MSEGSQSASEDTVSRASTADFPLTYAAMTNIAADIKSTFSAAITDLKANILVLTEQLSLAEQADRYRDKAIK